jgi:hypothetical protein
LLRMVHKMSKRGKATFRARDLRVARETAKPGDVVKVWPNGTVEIITGEAAQKAAQANPFEEEADRLRRQATR